MHIYTNEKELGEFIKAQMKTSKITYEEMAVQIGVSLATFKRIVKTPYNASYGTMKKLLSELGGEICIELPTFIFTKN